MYYRKEYINSNTGRVEPCFGCYYKEDVDGDVLTEDTYYTYYNEDGGIWHYHHDRDYIEESELKMNPEMSITKERYLEMLEVLHQSDILRMKYNKLFEKL